MTASTLSIQLAEIGELPADQYVGLIDETAIACLSVRLAAHGLLTPIWLRRNGNAAAKPWSVIAGRHRLRAASALGWAEIEAVEKAGPGSDDEQLRALQVTENLDRRSLRPIERAGHIMERWRVAANSTSPGNPKNQQAAAIRARWSVSATIADAPAGAVELIDNVAAAECGIQARTVRLYRKLFTAIVTGLPDLFAPLNAHPLGESLSAMTQLAALNFDARRIAAAMILTRADWVNLQEALVAAGIRESTGNRADPTKPNRAVMDAWHKMSLPKRRAHCEWLVEEVTPGMAVDMVAGFRRRGLLP